MTKPNLSLPADQAVPSDMRVPGGLFPMLRCLDCGWRFHTVEGRQLHREQKHGWVSQHHGGRRASPAVHGAGRGDLVQLAASGAVHDVRRGLQELGRPARQQGFLDAVAGVAL